MRIIMMRASGVGERTARAVVAAVGTTAPRAARQAPRHCGSGRMGGGRDAAQRAGSPLARSVPALARRGPQGRGRSRPCRAEDRRHPGGGAGVIDTAGPIASLHRLRRRCCGARALPSRPSRRWLGSPRSNYWDPREIGDIRRAAHATLAPPPERFAEFDALFDAHFLGAVSAGLESEPSEDEPLRAAEEFVGRTRADFRRRDRANRAPKRPRAERLSARRFAPGDDGETLRRFARALPGRVPRRRGYRWRSARGGPGTDARRMFRDAMRHAGEFIRLRRRKRRLRQRRIVLLIDVSGSMKERTQAHLAFAHALVRARRSCRGLHHRYEADPHYPAAAPAQPRAGARHGFARRCRLGRRHPHRRSARRFSRHPALCRTGARSGAHRAFGRARARRSDRDGRRGRALRPASPGGSSG